MKSTIREHKLTRNTIARGYKHSANLRHVAVRFDPAMFEKIRNLAVANNIGFGAQVRKLVERSIQP